MHERSHLEVCISQFIASDQCGRRARGRLYQAPTVSAPSLTLQIAWSQSKTNLALKLSRHVPLRVCIAHVAASLASTSSAIWPNFGGCLSTLHVLKSSGWLGLAESLPVLKRTWDGVDALPKSHGSNRSSMQRLVRVEWRSRNLRHLCRWSSALERHRCASTTFL